MQSGRVASSKRQMKTKNQTNIICSNCQCFSHSNRGIAITDEKNVLRIQSYTYKCLNHNPRPRILR